MDATELGRWTRFAAKGGIGKCTALQDCIAEQAEDLMFMKDDEITVLMQIPGKPDIYLGYCEGVVGNFQADAVRFHGRLKKPVLTKRQSALSSPVSRPGSSQSAFTVAARDNPSPALPSALSSTSISAFSPAVSPQPERSLSHASSFATTAESSAPITPADDDLNSPTIAPPTPDSDGEAAPPPIQAGQLAKLLASDSPLDPHFDSFNHSSSQDRDSSIYDDSEPSTRISVALSDGGAGIGLSLLQNFAGGGDDDSDSDDDTQSIRRTLSPESTVEGPPDAESLYSQSPRSAVRPLSPRVDSQPPLSARSDSHYSNSPRSVNQPLSPRLDSQPPLSARSGSHYSQSPESAVQPLSPRGESQPLINAFQARSDSPASLAQPPLSARSQSQYSQSPRSIQPPLSPPADSPSHANAAQAAPSVRSDSPASLPPPEPPLSARSGSQYSDSPSSGVVPLPSAHSESDYGGEDWEGADDIYDDYRYSRYSMASKMSRFSKGSMYTVASTSEVVPPIPTEHSRPSLDSLSRDHVRKGSKEAAHSKLSTSVSAADDDADAEETMSRLQKNRPAPLTFRKEPEPSPLLHATFGSPQASPTAHTATTASFASPTLMSPVYPTNTGAATNLRKRLEQERDAQDDDLPQGGSGAGKERAGLGQELTVGDRGQDEGMPLSAVSQAAEIVEGTRAASPPPPTPAVRASAPAPATEPRSPRSPRSPRTQASSSARDEKRMMMIANADPEPDQPPPPPYSVTAAPVASSSQAPAPAPAQVQPPPSSSTASVPQAQAQPRPGPSSHPQARPVDPNRPPADMQGRQSLFLPHPGAPKPAPASASAGPMYGRQPAPMPPPVQGPRAGSVHQVLQLVFAARREGRPHPPTIYARFEWDLAASVGPVPISFALEPQNNVPANRARTVGPWVQGAPSRTASPAGSTMGAPGGVGDPSGRQNAMSPAGRQDAMSPPMRQNAMSPPGRQDAMSPPGRQDAMSPPGRMNAMSPPARMDAMSPPGRQNALSPPLQGGPIQRANFTPAAGTARPRSRSFSGFENGNQEDRMQALARGSREEGAAPLASVKPLQITTKRSKSALATTPTTVTPAAPVAAPQRATVSHAASVVRGVHAPSPLSLSANNTVAGGAAAPVRAPPPPRASTNPLPTSQPHPSAGIVEDADALARTNGTPGPGGQVARALSLDQAAGALSVNSPHGMNGFGRAEQQMQSPLEALQESFARGASPPASPRSARSFPKASPVLRHSRSAVLSTTSSRTSEGVSSPRSVTGSLRPSVDTQRTGATSPTESTSETSSPVLGLKINKKNRPYMPPLRLVTSKDSSINDPRSPTLSTYTSTSEHTVDQETVQVQDMDFELVRPTMPMSPFAGSVDSLPLPSPMRADGFLRADSPAMSSASGSSSLRIPGEAASSSSGSPNDLRSPLKPDGQMEAHRHREQRWIAAMAAVPAAQARKSKKIRKLVLEGVPASVRYQVWATLADSKGKRMDGLYQRLAQREKVPAFADIERDIRECFVPYPELQDGSLAKMLQAYLSMVPDVQYSKGLALIAGQLLLQSPEEDAFWTFISLMDSHLRPYFSNSVQLEVDASLFAKALEANDPASAKKVFGDMGIPPATVCRPWFTAVFADTLAPDYLLRVWDVFLFEGVTFLFRVALAIFAGCRQLVLQSTSPDALLHALCHPPPTALPLNPETFIELALSVKLKDDDVRKQRGKLEAQVKRRTQPRASPLATTPTISLPKS